LKSQSLRVAELHSGSKNLKVGHSTQAAYYFTVHGNFTLLAQTVLLVVNLCTKIEISSYGRCMDRENKNVKIGHVTPEMFPLDLILQIFG